MHAGRQALAGATLLAACKFICIRAAACDLAKAAPKFAQAQHVRDGSMKGLIGLLA
jgi:hypothetical protein